MRFVRGSLCIGLRDQAKASPELALPAYRDQPWARTYWREQAKSSAQSYEAYPFGMWRARPFSGEALNIDEKGLRRTTDTSCADGAPVVYCFWRFSPVRRWRARLGNHPVPSGETFWRRPQAGLRRELWRRRADQR